MKRFISVLITVFVLLSVLAAPAHAERTPRFYLTGPSSAKTGDTVKIAVNVEGDYQAHIIRVEVEFDASAVRFVSAENGAAANAMKNASGMLSGGLTTAGNVYSLGVLMPVSAASAEGVLYELTFVVLSYAGSSLDFTLSVPEFGYMPLNETSATPIACTTESLTMTVSGGSGANATPTPNTTPKPGTTTAPTDPNTTNPPSTDPTQGAGNATQDPTVTGDPSVDPNLPGSITSAPADPGITPDPNNTKVTDTIDPNAAPDPETVSPDAPGGRTADNRPLKTGLIIIIVVLILALAGVCVYFFTRSKKKGEK